MHWSSKRAHHAPTRPQPMTKRKNAVMIGRRIVMLTKAYAATEAVFPLPRRIPAAGEGMSCRKIHDSADKHSDAAHSKRFGIGRIEGKDFFSENGSEGECGGGTDKGPFNACPFKRVHSVSDFLPMDCPAVTMLALPKPTM